MYKCHFKKDKDGNYLKDQEGYYIPIIDEKGNTIPILDEEGIK